MSSPRTQAWRAHAESRKAPCTAGTLENKTAVGTPVAAQLEDPSRSLLTPEVGGDVGPVLGRDGRCGEPRRASSHESRSTTSVAQARWVVQQSKKAARARATSADAAATVA